MHNLPTNNETNIIRNIFNVSTQLNESKNAYLRPINELADVTEKEINAISDPELRAKTMDQFIKTKATKAETAKLNAESEAINKERLQIASGEPSQEYKDFVAGVPGGKPREGASAFARADYAARQREAEDKAASDVRRAKEAEESKARVKAWQSSPEYQKQVEADRAKAAAKKVAREAANVVSQREQPESTAAKVDAAITTAATAVGLPKVGEVVSGALGIDAASRREAALAAEGEKARKHYETETSKPEYIARQTEDPRMLPQLVTQGKISQEEAEKKLEQHLKLRGGHDDISQHTEKRLKDLRATPPTPAPAVEPYKKNQNTLVKSAFEDIYSDLKRGWNWLTGNKTEMKESYYHRLANLFEETRDSLEDISAKRRERQVKVAGLEGQVNPHGFVDLVKGIRNVQAFSGMGGADMPKERVEKSSENVGERTVAKADQRKALMAIMSASQDHEDLKDRFTKEDALNPHSPLHKMLVSRNPDLRDESKVMAKYHTGS